MSNYTNLNDYKQQVAGYFNARTNYDASELANRRAESFLKLLPLKKGDKVLDIATGTGLIAIPVAEMVGKNGKVIGVDIATALLKQAQNKIDKFNLDNIELIEVDAEYLNFNENSFDAVLCCSAVMVFQNIPTAFKDWYRLLKPGGIVAFNAYAETSLMTPAIIQSCASCGISLPNIHEPLGTEEKCEILLKEAGYNDIKVITEQFGKYIPVDNAKKIFDANTWIHPENPLLQLSLEKKESLKAEFAKIIENLATEKGLWHDITTFFVLAKK
ncbi:methylase involved in ubiquinone/menaquinone biosynthesis [Rivularia sp. PCC 7116]|uniref:methyltransferase domain-containing protein n=1 Tax=Rivularia sp. PCC 7116 TaxID=373994 RepID=UPI00029F1316|nr:methyltransferase domain-containing protein [Rivularia sp. PCC 7116]AFY55360.1 methylase involved in ubiquinone/menaquinone biosynthesis [Rivularia sp. PCC 7116]